MYSRHLRTHPSCLYSLPTRYAAQLAALLFGDANRWGKLPYTMYPHAYAAAQPMANYDMAKPPGRTYRYYLGDGPGGAGAPLFPFGTGLSYTSFALDCALALAPRPLAVTCQVRNTGGRDGDEVVMLYHAAGADVRAAAARASPPHPVPRKALVDFARVSVAAGATATVEFALSEASFLLVNGDGDRTLYHGARVLELSNGAGQAVMLNMTI
jgi:hypothetical protein